MSVRPNAPARAATVAAAALAAAAVIAFALLAHAAPALAATGHAPTPTPASIVVDGPSPDISSLNGLSVARDGTGGLVYLRSVAGVTHVFVSLLRGGIFTAPIQIDSGLLGPSSQPVIAAGNGGVVLVGFINGGELWTAQTSVGSSFAAPQPLYPSAANPAISMSNFGKAYLAFTATDGAGGADVRAAYYYQGAWGLEPTPLDDNPADSAGTGTGRPAVATSGDGIAIVAWGENGHIFTRRVIKTSASTADERADVASLDGWSEVSASEPEVATGGDDTYASVVFDEQIASGGSQQSRVLFNRLHGSRYDGIVEADGQITGGVEGATDPQTGVTEYGAGWVVSSSDQSDGVFASTLGGNEFYENTVRIDSQVNGAPPVAVPGIAGLTSTFIAWQQTPGVAGPAEIRLRFAPDGSDLGPEQVISSPALGATDAAQGLATGGDSSGDAVLAWVQGTGPGTQIVGQLLLQPPGGFAPASSFEYARTSHPLFAWSAPNELMGPPRFTVYVDGGPVAQTTATQIAVPPVIPDGRHTWQVVATNEAGVSTTAVAARVFIDTVAPKVSFTVSGTRVIGYIQHLALTVGDRPPAGRPSSAASGVKTVTVRWGDGTTQRVAAKSAAHVFTRRRTYTVTVTAVDRAGNATVVKKRVKILAKVPRHRASTRTHVKKKKKGKRGP